MNNLKSIESVVERFRKLARFGNDGEQVLSYEMALDDISKTITQRDQAIKEELLESFYEVAVEKTPTIKDEAWANQFASKAEAFWYGEAKGVENIKDIINQVIE